jgi:acyl carrier protein
MNRTDPGSTTVVSVPTQDDLLHTVQHILAMLVDHPGGSPAEVFTAASRILDFGVNSVQLLQIHARLEAALGRQVPRSVLFDCDSIGELVDHLAALG